MRKTTAVGLAAGAMFGVMMAATPPAYADTNTEQYLNNVRSLGWYGTDGELLHGADRICAWREMGVGVDEVRHRVYMDPDVAVDADQSVIVTTIYLAQNAFCPWVPTT